MIRDYGFAELIVFLLMDRRYRKETCFTLLGMIVACVIAFPQYALFFLDSPLSYPNEEVLVGAYIIAGIMFSVSILLLRGYVNNKIKELNEKAERLLMEQKAQRLEDNFEKLKDLGALAQRLFGR